MGHKRIAGLGRSMRKGRIIRLHVLPTASGGIARAAHARAELHSLTLRPLLAQAGLTLHQMKDRKARIGVRNQIEYLNLISSGLRDDFLGMHLAQDLDLRDLGLLYYV